MPLAAFPKCFLDQMCVSKEMSVDQWIILASKLDIDGLEFYWGFTPFQDPSRLSAIRKQVTDLDMSIPMMCYSSDFTKPESSERDEEVAAQILAIETTAALGGRYCRVLSGQRRPGLDLDDGLSMVAECITKVLPVAQREGVALVLENHYKDGYWDYPEFAQKQDVFLRLLEAVGEHPYFGVNYDPSNAIVAGDDPLSLLEAVKSRVLTMHASDRWLDGGSLEDLQKLDQDPQHGYASILNHGVIGSGLNDYDAIFKILAEVRFKGWISIEDGQDPEVGMEHLHQSAAFLRKKMSQYGLC